MGMIPYLFLVKYDLSGDNREKDYLDLDRVLTGLKGYRLSDSCWLVRFQGGGSDNLRGHIEYKSNRVIIEGDDRLIIAKLGGNDMSGLGQEDILVYPTTEEGDVEAWKKSSMI